MALESGLPITGMNWATLDIAFVAVDQILRPTLAIFCACSFDEVADLLRGYRQAVEFVTCT